MSNTINYQILGLQLLTVKVASSEAVRVGSIWVLGIFLPISNILSFFVVNSETRQEAKGCYTKVVISKQQNFVTSQSFTYHLCNIFFSTFCISWGLGHTCD